MPSGEITFRGRLVSDRDWKLWVCRQFLIVAARDAHPPTTDPLAAADLLETFVEWEWPGPGVFSGPNLERYCHGGPDRESFLRGVVASALASLAARAPTLPLQYLKENFADGTVVFGDGVDTSVLLPAMDKIRQLVADPSIEAPDVREFRRRWRHMNLEPHPIAIDWSTIATESQLWDQICRQGSEPAWHGRNIAALVDSWVTGGINPSGPPYAFCFTHCASIPPRLREVAVGVMDVARTSVAVNGGAFTDV